MARVHSRFTRALCAFLLGSSSVMAATLLVGSNDGPIVSYSFANNVLTKISSNSDSTAASWQTVTPNFVYSVSETSGTVPGVVTAYSITNGVLKKISSDKGLPGPVNIAVAESGTMLIAAAYGGHGVNTFSVSTTGVVKTTGTFSYTDKSINPTRQTTSFPHQVVVDPTAKFAVVPDLGADFIRIFRIKNAALTLIQNVQAAKGSGPRHGVFWPRKTGVKPTFYFLVAEMSSTVTAYKVTYSADGETMSLDTASAKVYSTFGAATKAGAAAGEIDISPDGRYMYVSNRLDVTFSNPPSDSIATWSINTDGTLSFIGLTRSGGLSPRHFSLVTIGGSDYMTVANPTSGDVAIFTRDVATGRLGTTPCASVKLSGAACATWKL